MARSNATKKKGNQQATNAPVIIASVFAAFLSRFDSIVSRVLLLDDVVEWLHEGFVTVVVVVVVVVDTADGVTVVDWVAFAPLYDDDFSGEIDEWSGVDLVMVNAVDSSLGLKFTRNSDQAEVQVVSDPFLFCFRKMRWKYFARCRCESAWSFGWRITLKKSSLQFSDIKFK